ncbi:aminotransferase class III-fold pyridoxal phosphate-dependent enzyme [Massilia sp. BJB1822]|uniref:aminotransferase class III-fold pyridoxal phosphate-dependent enzyme n=1 Tax=Massilia sp. BJB1822 TaxID=2744470 RepID=UPI0015946570|nr:aminotransferase class III-fold pyridoxal phosphate-dependent enzyme [Massilia sp. BJB1822]NVE00059.1 aminotransferase class III-fold pyridoxal phosphate-dependent enzyme [Massilia sp. BJB1822]
MHKENPVASVFQPANTATLELLQRFNDEKRCTFLTSSNYMHAETAKLGYVLSSRLARISGQSAPYRTFFVNSSLEALSGAIKLARQTSVREKKDDQGWVLLLDEVERFPAFLDPTGRGMQEGFTPHVALATSLDQARQLLPQHRWAALLHVRRPGAGAADAALISLIGQARQQGAMIVSVDTELSLADPHFGQPGHAADVTVYGENLSDRQVPFGCFTMTSAAHAVWNNDVDCFAQTSTFGGNRACPAVVLEALERHGHISAEQLAQCRRIDADFKLMLETWGKHVNPGMAQLGPIFGMDLDVRQAWGGRLRTGEGREILDCSGGFGSNLRGHNSADIPALLQAHDRQHDYFADLAGLLGRLSGFPRAFPAVSGATAVDVAASMGMLANSSRKKVVTFKGNFSGKTLFSLNFSKHGPQLTESDQDAFRPYYAELVYLDPFAPDALEQLTAVLRGGDVALVWFEMIRGGMCEALPEPLLAAIDAHKQEGGYLIGVDEVLTGGWRTGASYLTHRGTVKGCDIVSIGKTLSDMTLPMAAVLVSEDVYQRAYARNAAHVERLQVHYRNQLSANIAFNALSYAADAERRAAALRTQQALQRGLEQIAASSKLFGGVRGRGALLLLTMNPKYFPFDHRSKLGNLLEMAMSHLIFVRCGVFVFLLRFLHRVSSSEADVQEILHRLEQGLRGVTPFMLYRYALSRILSPKLPRLAALLSRGVRKVDLAPQMGDRAWQRSQEAVKEGGRP